jgi:hypothetical protein
MEGCSLRERRKTGRSFTTTQGNHLLIRGALSKGALSGGRLGRERLGPLVGHVTCGSFPDLDFVKRKVFQLPPSPECNALGAWIRNALVQIRVI